MTAGADEAPALCYANLDKIFKPSVPLDLLIDIITELFLWGVNESIYINYSE